MANIKKGDLVQVITGATQERGGDRGKQGKVIEVLKDKNRVVVEGVNFVTKHVRVGQTQRGSKTGGIEQHEASIHVSNVASSTRRRRSRRASASAPKRWRRTASRRPSVSATRRSLVRSSDD